MGDREREDNQETTNRNIKKGRRFIKGSLSNIRENEDNFRKKKYEHKAKNLNQIKASARHVRRDEYDEEGDHAQSHKYLLRFLEVHNNSRESWKLFKSLSDPELSITGSDGQSRYIFP